MAICSLSLSLSICLFLSLSLCTLLSLSPRPPPPLCVCVALWSSAVLFSVIFIGATRGRHIAAIIYSKEKKTHTSPQTAGFFFFSPFHFCTFSQLSWASTEVQRGGVSFVTSADTWDAENEVFCSLLSSAEWSVISSFVRPRLAAGLNVNTDV